MPLYTSFAMLTTPCPFSQWMLNDLTGFDHLQPDNSGTTPLHLACVNGHVSTAAAILGFDGASCNALKALPCLAFTKPAWNKVVLCSIVVLAMF